MMIMLSATETKLTPPRPVSIVAALSIFPQLVVTRKIHFLIAPIHLCLDNLNKSTTKSNIVITIIPHIKPFVPRTKL